MGQKINPISLRLESTNRKFDSCWFSDYYYSNLISQDLNIQSYINSILKQIEYPSARFFIQSFQKKTKIFLLFYNPIESRKIRKKIFQLKNYKIVKKRKFFFKKQNIQRLKNTQSIKNLYFYYFLFQNYLYPNFSLLSNNDKKNKLTFNSILAFFFKKKLNIFYKNKKLKSFKENKIKPKFKLLLEEKALSPIYKQINLSDFQYRKHIEFFLKNQYNIDFHLSPIKVTEDYKSALFLAEEIVYYLERRVSFRKIKYKLFREIKNSPLVKGIRIVCSGRLGGRSKKAQRAKIDSFKYGQTSLHVFSSYLDFALKTAKTRFGTMGIKVWICYNPELR
jgi:ribosomal protein S3